MISEEYECKLCEDEGYYHNNKYYIDKYTEKEIKSMLKNKSFYYDELCCECRRNYCKVRFFIFNTLRWKIYDTKCHLKWKFRKVLFILNYILFKLNINIYSTEYIRCDCCKNFRISAEDYTDDGNCCLDNHYVEFHDTCKKFVQYRD